MKRHDDLLNVFTNGINLPTEAIPGLPLVEISGDKRVLIENHKGVSVYSVNEIHVKVSYGCLCIYGSNLELAQMTKQQLVVTGVITSVTISRGNSR